MSREARYSGLETGYHLRQLDLDLDELEADHRSFKKEIRDSVREFRQEFQDKAQSSSRMQIAILSSLVVASILMVINIIALGGGS